MATVIKLGQLAEEGIHVPRVDGYPLYARVDGAAERSEKWQEAAQVIFNSPTNVRNVAITHNRIITETYVGIFKNGKRERKIFVKHIGGNDWVSCYNEYMQSEPMSRLEYSVKGTGLEAIIKPWVCANIEKIYLDWAFLMDSEVRTILMDRNIREILSGQRKMPSDVLLDIVGYFLGCQPGRISVQFPRLNTIIFNLRMDDFISASGNIGNNLATRLSNDPGSTVVRLTGAKWSKFSIRQGIYKYDDEVLKKCVSKFTVSPNAALKEKIDRSSLPGNKEEKSEQAIIAQPVQSEAVATNEAQTERPTEKCNEEKLLFSIYQKTGFKGLRKALKVCDLQDLMPKLTDDGYKLCKRALSQE